MLVPAPVPSLPPPRSFTTKRAPRAARASAYVISRPPPAPVMTATRPSNRMSFIAGVPPGRARVGAGSGCVGPSSYHERSDGRSGAGGPPRALLEGAADLAAPAVDLAELHDRLLRHRVAHHAPGLAAQLRHVDPLSVQMSGALGDDAGVEQRLDEHAEEVRALAQHAPPLGVAEGFQHRG